MASHEIAGARRVVVPTEGSDGSVSVVDSVREDGLIATINSLDLSTASVAAIVLGAVLIVVAVTWYKVSSQAGTRRAMGDIVRTGNVKSKRKVQHQDRDKINFRALRKSRPEVARDDASREIYLRAVSPDPKARPFPPDQNSEPS